MILLAESWWILPSCVSQRPRTVMVVGRCRQIDLKFLLERLAEFRGFQRVNHGLKCGPKFQMIQRKTSRVLDRREVGVDLFKRLRLHKARNDENS